MKKKFPKYLEKGMEFGRLTVIGIDEDSKIKDGMLVKPSRWVYICRCSCVEENIIGVSKLRLITNNTKSCGCLHKESLVNVHNRNIKTNPIEDCGDYIKIFFFNCDNYTIIDTEDYDKVKDFCWCKVSSNIENLFYARSHTRGTNKNSIKMHQLILPTEDGFIPDHKDGNGLNNRKSNLRVATIGENNRNTKVSSNNTSGHKGVSWHTKIKKWMAYINVDNKNIYLGYFSNINNAIKARKEAEEVYHGKFSYDNSRGGIDENSSFR